VVFFYWFDLPKASQKVPGLGFFATCMPIHANNYQKGLKGKKWRTISFPRFVPEKLASFSHIFAIMFSLLIQKLQIQIFFDHYYQLLTKIS
jgi:hypothetical protein